MGKLTISMAIFNSFLYDITRGFKFPWFSWANFTISAGPLRGHCGDLAGFRGFLRGELIAGIAGAPGEVDELKITMSLTNQLSLGCVGSEAPKIGFGGSQEICIDDGAPVSSIAKLVHIIPITMVGISYRIYTYNGTMVYKPTYNWGAPPYK